LNDHTATQDLIAVQSGRDENPDDPDPSASLTLTQTGSGVWVSIYGGTILFMPNLTLAEVEIGDFTLDGESLVSGVNTNLPASAA
jgi:hypothetical protein